MLAPQSIAAKFNRHCHCIGTDVPALQGRLDDSLHNDGAAPLASTHPHLFAQSPVFVAREHIADIQRIVAAIESTVKLPLYRQQALADAPSIAQAMPPSPGVFLAYDFHMTAEGPKLIEINTNAGGAMLNVALMRTQLACCPEVYEYLNSQPGPDGLEETFLAMFRNEWRLSRGTSPLTSVAIVDDRPREQYLYPEFLLFQRLFQRHGIRCLIAAPTDLRYEGGALWIGPERIDLIYNRLTDFYLQEPAHASLAAAYRDQVVLTPHPHAHALYANKRNLTLLSSPQALRKAGAIDETIALLIKSVPRTLRLRSAETEQWWATRKQWFFKPAYGFGSRGSYRGDKLTKKVFAEIVDSDYVAQEFVPPSERHLHENGDGVMKFDIRAYVYDGLVQLVAARLYQGQTTNFRTPGGGFAPIYFVSK